MFPISSNGVFEDPSIFLEQEKFVEDLFVDFSTSEGNENTENGGKKRARKASSASSKFEANKEGGGSESRKSAHRLTEKQRRQEMTSLYASLRALLPLEYIKGKRAISDHMQQAVSYINDAKKNIEEMKVRRDSLKKACNASTAAIKPHDQNESLIPASDYCVKINLFGDGLEILISSSLNKDCLPLSMVLEDLLERQLNVINCVSTRGDHCYLHKIHIEMNDSTSIDISELQEGLGNVLKHA